jgi:hypothetical protein
VSAEFYATSIQHLMQRWKKCVYNEGDLVKSNLNFVKNVPMIYANFIIIVISFCEKTGGFTFILSLVCYATGGQPTLLILNFLQ